MPYVRIEVLLRSIFTTRWDDETWSIGRQQVPRGLKLRTQVSKDGWWN